MRRKQPILTQKGENLGLVEEKLGIWQIRIQEDIRKASKILCVRKPEGKVAEE